MSNNTDFQEFDLRAPGTDCLVLRETDEFLLLHEMHHRFANTLTVLMSVLRREFALSASPELRDSLARCEMRIVAFGNLHRFLVVGAANDWISVQYYIEHLCEALSEALLKPLGVRCEVFVDAGEFAGERCERLGLVITELVTNAAKHAFHGRNDGLVRVAYQQDRLLGLRRFRQWRWGYDGIARSRIKNSRTLGACFGWQSRQKVGT